MLQKGNDFAFEERPLASYFKQNLVAALVQCIEQIFTKRPHGSIAPVFRAFIWCNLTAYDDGLISFATLMAIAHIHIHSV
ncbi:hypothetical protein Tcan_04887 [Toxocara canis]|uniref:Uncharacterized protein n=1 Tax=Toxocara canis TaxID=6265 RepID=A0A0B2W4A1_TOXCA|nr:hypothetical protein Tcan_04887 [Toxocara canis]